VPPGVHASQQRAKEGECTGEACREAVPYLRGDIQAVQADIEDVLAQVR
jgi:hypothetical protein